MLIGNRRTSQYADDLLPTSMKCVCVCVGGSSHLSLGLSSSFQANFIKKPYRGGSYQLLRLIKL